MHLVGAVRRSWTSRDTKDISWRPKPEFRRLFVAEFSNAYLWYVRTPDVHERGGTVERYLSSHGIVPGSSERLGRLPSLKSLVDHWVNSRSRNLASFFRSSNNIGVGNANLIDHSPAGTRLVCRQFEQLLLRLIIRPKGQTRPSFDILGPLFTSDSVCLSPDTLRDAQWVLRRR